MRRLAVIALLLLGCLAAADTWDDMLWSLRSPLSTGLTAFWQLEESTGTRYDRTANANNLTANNSPGVAAAKIRNGADLTRASVQYFSIASNPSLTFTNTSLEITAWCKLNSFIGEHHWIVSKFSGAPPGEWELSYRVSSNAFRWNLVSNSTDYVVYSTNVPTATGVWYFVRAYYDATTHEVGLSVSNATKVTLAGPNSIVASSSALQVGNEDGGAGGTNSFDGLIDELAIWKRRLTDAEAGLIYTNTAPTGSLATWPRFY